MTYNVYFEDVEVGAEVPAFDLQVMDANAAHGGRTGPYCSVHPRMTPTALLADLCARVQPDLHSIALSSPPRATFA